MAVESEIAVVFDGSDDQEELKEVLSKDSSSSNVVVCGGDNGGLGGGGSSDNGGLSGSSADDGGGSVGSGSGSGESKTGSNSSDIHEQEKNKIRILVSGKKKPLFFYIHLAKKFLHKSYDVELLALGLAIPTVITISEFLKRNGLAVEKNISTSTVTKADEEKGRAIVKAQIAIVLGPCDKLDEVSAVIS